MRAIRVAPGRFAEISELSGVPQAELSLRHLDDVKKGQTTLYYVEENEFRLARSST